MDHKRPTKRSQKKECDKFDKVCIERDKGRPRKTKPPERKYGPPAGRKEEKKVPRGISHKITTPEGQFEIWKGESGQKSTFTEREAMRILWRKKNIGVKPKNRKRLTDKEVEDIRKRLNLK